MSGHRPRGRLLCLAAACAVPVLYALSIRPRMLTWGATPDETACAYPGDELVPDPNGGATMATTLLAPPEKVWPRLVQLGLAGQQRTAERKPCRARVAEPGSGTASQGPDELVDRAGCGP